MRNTRRLVALLLCLLLLVSCSEAPSDPAYTDIALSGLDQVIDVNDLPQLVEKATAEVEIITGDITLLNVSGRIRCNQLPGLEGEIHLLFGKKPTWSYRIAAAIQVNASIDTTQQILHLRTQELSYLNLDPIDSQTFLQIATVVNAITSLFSTSAVESDCVVWIAFQGDGIWRAACESAIEPDFRGCEYLVNGVTGEIEVITPHD